MKFLFIQAHPDDLEFNISNFMITVANQPSNEVRILSLTKGEYGTYIKEIKGVVLGRIREKELRDAAKIEGITDIEFLGYIDGHFEISTEAIQKMKKTLQDFKPDIVFAPECLYYYYSHSDHVRTGLIVYRLLSEMPDNNRPQMFMYSSYVNTHYFPMMHRKRQSKALLTHKSQYWLLIPGWPLRYILGFYFGLRLPKKFHRYVFAEAYRKVDFQEDKVRQLTLKQRIIGRIVQKMKMDVNPFI
ncbi:MAG: PIG-L family deacetylase [Promethearchaeota archaeon]|nr:MAG: PIG-L family deacetylase [Candidatus Lokiarchaeota archaeon]